MTIRSDLHVHTRYSVCSSLKPEKVIKTALKRGIDCVAVTDHNTLSGAREVLSLAGTRLKVITGEEIRTSEGEITGYFLKDEIPPFMTPLETIELIKAQGGLVSVPHPFDRLRSSRLSLNALETVIEQVDMIEVFNSRDIFTRQDTGILEKAYRAGVASVAVSDAHLSVEIGRSYMLMDDFSNADEFMCSIKKAGRVARKSPLWVHLVTKVIKFRNRKKGRR